jgi:putative intracellular protease/amidase
MRRSIIAGAAIAGMLILASNAWSAPGPTPTSPSDAAATGARLILPPPKAGRARPLVVVLADNGGTETTDFVIPFGVLKESGAADVLSVSTGPGVVTLMPALRVRADETIAEFDAATPAGADIVVVPAMMNDADPRVIAWVKAQYVKGATLVSICEGARILARAGLLEGKSATTHWSALNDLAAAYPATRWIRDRRYVQDGRIISTTGVTASIPASLALVEAIAGQAVASATAARLGAKDWSDHHVSADFSLANADLAEGVWNYLAFWRHETVQAPVWEGIDEIRLALETDTWTRTYRSQVVSTNRNTAEIRSLRGLRLEPDARPSAEGYVLPVYPGGPVMALDGAVNDINHRFGPSTARLVTLGLEYPR